MSKSLLLLGGVLPAVQLLRRAQDYVDKVHIIAQDDDAIVLSRYGEKFLYSQPQDCICVIRQWMAGQAGNVQQWLVVPCSEFFVQYIEEFRAHGFEVFAPASQVLSTFYDKKTLYGWLDTLGVRVAEFKSLDSQLDFNDDKSYIIKSAKASDGYSAPFKTRIITQESELQTVRQIIPAHYWDNFVIQRLHQHNQSISYGGVWMNGQEVASIIARQVRQYPQGITSCTVRATDVNDTDTIHQVISRIAANVRLHGFIELEFIKNEAGLYPIDLNPRLWGWSNFLFYNFPAIPAVIFQNQPVHHIDRKHIESWSNIWRDVPAIIKSKKSVTVMLQLLFSLFKVSRKDFIFWHDIKPEFSAILQKIRKGQRKS